MNENKKYEYEIALKIFSYDLDIINKDIFHMEYCLQKYANDETMVKYAKKRLADLIPLKIKKETQINELNNKYQNN